MNRRNLLKVVATTASLWGHYLAPADARAAFERKAVDAWAIWDPFYAAVELAIKPRILTTGRGLSSNNSISVTRIGLGMRPSLWNASATRCWSGHGLGRDQAHGRRRPALDEQVHHACVERAEVRDQLDRRRTVLLRQPVGAREFVEQRGDGVGVLRRKGPRRQVERVWRPDASK